MQDGCVRRNGRAVNDDDLATSEGGALQCVVRSSCGSDGDADEFMDVPQPRRVRAEDADEDEDGSADRRWKRRKRCVSAAKVRAMSCPICGRLGFTSQRALQKHAERCEVVQPAGDASTEHAAMDDELRELFRRADACEFAPRFAMVGLLSMSALQEAALADESLVHDLLAGAPLGVRARLLHELAAKPAVYKQSAKPAVCSHNFSVASAPTTSNKSQSNSTQIGFKPSSAQSTVIVMDSDEACAPAPVQEAPRSVQLRVRARQQTLFQALQLTSAVPATTTNNAAKPGQRVAALPRHENESARGGQTRQHASNKRVPATTFTVDSFRAARGFCRQFFLSHFHSDHYGGLTRRSALGSTIYCSAVTARLITQQLGVPAACVQALPLNTAIDIPDLGLPAQALQTVASHASDQQQPQKDAKRGATVTLLDANHCPGSVMFLFFVWSTGRFALHTGDCRLERDFVRSLESLREFLAPYPSAHCLSSPMAATPPQRRLDYLFLDTTYCDARYAFPAQREVVDAVVTAARTELSTAAAQLCGENGSPRRVLLVFGSYTIGKERVFMAVARALKLGVWVDARKLRVLRCLEWDSDADRARIGSGDAHDAQLRVVPMRHITHSALAEMLRNSRGRYNAVVGFRPTGWSWPRVGSGSSDEKQQTLNGGKVGGTMLRRTTSGASVIYEVPYSEHSSFAELREFVAATQPREIIPTVGASSSHKRLVQQLLAQRVPSNLRRTYD
mmetsp:Transcript_13784/g.36989  ORF Transcript_13784/g.36989 Transcript_13784/m.36989 type:complete len:735 (+) Transcript_13784:138-2342(+)